MKRYVRYLLQPHELWARSFAQYVAVKSGNKKLIDGLSVVRKLDKKTGLVESQWSDEDFKPVFEEIDKLFLGLGWIKKREKVS